MGKVADAPRQLVAHASGRITQRGTEHRQPAAEDPRRRRLAQQGLTGDSASERALARARLPHDAQDLAREQLKINPVDSDLTDAVAERQVVSANGDGGVTHAHNLRHVTAG